MTELSVKIAKGINNNSDAKLIRQNVFIYEQGFESEFDDVDETAVHCVIYDNGFPVATGRLFEQNKNAHIGRVAVQKPYRKKSIGKMVVNCLEEYAKKQGYEKCELSAQMRAKEFYEKIGYTAQGDVYMDEYCPHILMTKKL